VEEYVFAFSLSPFPGLNWGTFLAGIGIVPLVWGLTPFLAFQGSLVVPLSGSAPFLIILKLSVLLSVKK